MSVKAVEMVRKIRDRRYQETKDLSGEEHKALTEKKSERLQARIRPPRRRKLPNNGAGFFWKTVSQRC